MMTQPHDGRCVTNPQVCAMRLTVTQIQEACWLNTEFYDPDIMSVFIKSSQSFILLLPLCCNSPLFNDS